MMIELFEDDLCPVCKQSRMEVMEMKGQDCLCCAGCEFIYVGGDLNVQTRKWREKRVVDL
jgi:hypothetical protein